MKKSKIIGLTLALIIAAGMTACSNNGTPAESGINGKDNSSVSLPTEISTVEKTSEGSTSEKPSAKEDEKKSAESPAADETPKKEEIIINDMEGASARDKSTAAYSAEAADSAAGRKREADSYAAVGDEPAEAPPSAGGDVIMPDDTPVPSDSDIYIIDDERPQAGLLTAGEWNDNDNWGFFTNLVNADKISFPSYGIEPRFRTKVVVKDKEDKPVVNAKVTMSDTDKNLLWSAVTDKNGIAYLFSDTFMSERIGTVELDGKIVEFSDLTDAVVPVNPDDPQNKKNSDSVEINVLFDGEGKNYKDTDIMFIVDATGSMSDEMVFLQSEFTSITDSVGDENTRYSVNFYRDEGDEYVTKCNDFTADVKELQTKLNSEYAQGGGDIPEAVDKILDETLTGSSWRDESVKLAFLIFDAPPHEGTEQSLINSIKTAAEKGIRLIPVVSSNSERETELFGRAIAITTGGTYVFLTDDSGIGDSHLEPIIGDYKVEKLNDLIVRVINSYKQ